MSPANPFGSGTAVPESTVDSFFDEEVNTKEAADVLKRNLPPQGTYITDPSESPGTIVQKKFEEKDRSGDPTGAVRRVATVIIRGTTKTKDRDEVSTMLRFDLSPDTRPKKVYEDKQWTGDVVEGKDDLSSQLWASAVKVFQETTGEPPAKQSDVLDFLATSVYAVRTMRGDDRLIVLGLQSRRKK